MKIRAQPLSSFAGFVDIKLGAPDPQHRL